MDEWGFGILSARVKKGAGALVVCEVCVCVTCVSMFVVCVVSCVLFRRYFFIWLNDVIRVAGNTTRCMLIIGSLSNGYHPTLIIPGVGAEGGQRAR